MDRERLKARILEIAKNPKGVRFDELETLLDNHIGPLFSNYNHHGNPHHAFTVGGHTFNISKPHGTPFIKKTYVMKFLDAMEAAGLYTAGDDE
jgi:hypothetical protein